MRYVVVTLIGGGIALLLGVLVGGICGTLFVHPTPGVIYIPGWFVGIVYGGMISFPIGAFAGAIYVASTPKYSPRQKDIATPDESRKPAPTASALDANFGDG